MFLKFALLTHALAVTLAVVIVPSAVVCDSAPGSRAVSSQSVELAVKFELTVAGDTKDYEGDLDEIEVIPQHPEMRSAAVSSKSVPDFGYARLSEEEIISLRMIVEVVRRFNAILETMTLDELIGAARQEGSSA